MKKIMKQGAALLLCLLMLLSLVGTASAEPVEDTALANEFVTEYAVSKGAPGKYVGGAGDAEWNELLGEMPQNELQRSYDTDDRNETKAAATFYGDSDTLEEVLAYIRQEMKARSSKIVFTLYSDETYDYDSFAVGIRELALEHTGVGDEGDYLRWLWRSRSYTYSGYAGQYVTYSFPYTYLTTAAQERAMTTAVSNLLTNLDLSGKTDYQKVRKIYDWICANVTYDYTGLNKGIDNSPLTWTPYKALTQGTSVCQGYALLFYRLALESGVDARFIGGTGDGGSHGWNIVKLGGKYYNLDATWDAGLTNYQWFLLTDANFVRHVRDAEYRTSDFYAAYPMGTSNYDPSTRIAGDMDGDGRLTTDDAVYLLLHVMFGAKDYPLAV